MGSVAYSYARIEKSCDIRPVQGLAGMLPGYGDFVSKCTVDDGATERIFAVCVTCEGRT